VSAMNDCGPRGEETGGGRHRARMFAGHYADGPLPGTSASVGRNILLLLQVRLREKQKKP
jgi:hypothetical protein